MDEPWRVAVDEGRRASEAGRHLDAAERFATAYAELATRVQDVEVDRDAIDVATLRAAALIYAGRLAAAAAELPGIVARAERHLGWSDPHTVRAALSLGTALFRRGEVEAAGAWWWRCQAAVDAGTVVSDQVRLLILNNLGGAHYHRGDHDAALASFSSAAEQMERTLGRAHRDLVRPYGNVAWVALEAGRLEEARVAAERAVEVAASTLADDDPEKAHPLMTLALVRNAAGRSREAAEMLRSVRARLPASHPLLVPVNVNLAEVHRWFGDLETAATYAAEAADVAERVMAPTDPMRLGAARAHAALALAAGDHTTAHRRVAELLALEDELDAGRVDTRVATRAIAAEAAGIAGDHERQLALAYEGLGLLDATPTLVLPDLEARLRIGVAEGLAAGGARDEAVCALDRLDALLGSTDALLPVTRRRAAEARMRVAAGGSSAERFEAAAAALAHVAAQRSGAFGVLDLTQRWRHTQRVIGWFEPLLAAPDLDVLQQRNGAEAWFDHHEAASTAASALLRWHQAADAPARAAAEAYAASLRRLASGVAMPETEGRTALLRSVQRLEQTLGAASFVSVEGALGPVRLDAVWGVLEPGESLLVFAWLERHLVVLRVDGSVGVERVAVAPASEVAAAVAQYRDRATAGDGVDRAATALLERLVPADLRRGGDVERIIVVPDGPAALVPWGAMLDRHRSRRALESIDVVQSTSVRRFVASRRAATIVQPGRPLIVAGPDFGAEHTAAHGFRGPLFDAVTTTGSYRSWLADLPIPRLEHAADEARVVARAIPDAEVVTGADATVERVLAVSGPRVLHVATHGFVYPGGDDLGLPLLRPVLAFAGARAAARAERGAATAGFLPALGLAALDLAGTELVVLSACDSGMGVTIPGEGVAGMPQALLSAGARAVIASLWRIEDRLTVDVVDAFYGGIERGLSPSRALLAVQRDRGHDGASSAFVCWA